MKTVELELDRLNVTVTGEDEHETRLFAQQLSQFYHFKDIMSAMGAEDNYQVLFDKIIESFTPSENDEKQLSSQNDKVMKGIVYSALLFFVNKHDISFEEFSLDKLTLNEQPFEEWAFNWLENDFADNPKIKLKYNGKKVDLSDIVDRTYFLSTISAGLGMMQVIHPYLAFAVDFSGETLYENYPILEDGEEPSDELFTHYDIIEDEVELEPDIILIQKNGLYGFSGVVDGDTLFEQCDKDTDQTLRHIMEKASHFNIKLSVGDQLNTEELSSIGFHVGFKKRLIRKPSVTDDIMENIKDKSSDKQNIRSFLSRNQVTKKESPLSSSNLSLSTEKEALSEIDLNDVDFGNQKPN